MRIAVTGHEGQVARSLAERASTRDRVVVITVGRPLLDLTRPETIMPALASVQPDIVVSAAAFTAVDQSEDEPDIAYAINEGGARAVAEAAANLGIPVIHLSTDYVFDGRSERPYTEDDLPAPQSVYGASKLAGENAVAEANPRHLILRTAWVYSPFGQNFVKTMLRLASERGEISVVADQCGNPTSALDIADAILHVANALGRERPEPWGIYNVAGAGVTNWADLARHVLSASREHGGPYAQVLDIATSQYPTKARRPASSRLATDKITSSFGWSAPEWRASVRAVVHRLVVRP
ncbi:dTDP-4-dehydrorhamnose reductase [Devosia sp. XJ19-1]|uniref:dTDP-4-dehydrorhamnose reductase n=1 Tax=Devosia ureilytica TaxID=2952754 RepID=A0A9Q4AM58_9HYPH|nr:dTDP-4-dehydrorhamnose reductase [Devosia ureilytica]MCP8883387.1 dTDP-4-dehydrorhamnose reductase [Devosia ureilytica]MCP8886245.1 dTDP-4-dehydrorhamnose reductase [Devosia ureilytica]